METLLRKFDQSGPMGDKCLVIKLRNNKEQVGRANLLSYKTCNTKTTLVNPHKMGCSFEDCASLFHQTDSALDLGVVSRIICNGDDITAIQFYIPADDLRVE